MYCVHTLAFAYLHSLSYNRGMFESSQVAMQFSVVVPVHNEAQSIDVYLENVLPILKSMGATYECIFVNDGSSDETLARLIACQARVPEIVIVDLSRNFGKEAALTAGLSRAKGQVVVPMDVDLQHPPELLPQMYAKWQAGHRMVVAARRHRGDRFLKKSTAVGFYKVFNALSETNLVPHCVDFRLMDRSVVDALLAMPEKNRFLKGMSAWLVDQHEVIYYDQPDRAQGVTSWRMKTLWQLAVDAITSFSSLPLRIWSYVGIAISLLTFLYAFTVVIKKLVFGDPVTGYASLMVAILFLGGIQLISLGVIGEYVGRLYTEAKNRPLYIVRKVYESNQ